MIYLCNNSLDAVDKNDRPFIYPFTTRKYYRHIFYGHTISKTPIKVSVTFLLSRHFVSHDVEQRFYIKKEKSIRVRIKWTLLAQKLKNS